MSRLFSFKNVMIWNGSDPDFTAGTILVDAGIIKDIAYRSETPCFQSSKWIIPAFTDSHIHLVNYGIARKHLFLDGLTLEAIQSRLRGIVSQSPSGQWIRGRGWEISCRLQGGFPDRSEIDEISQDNPVVLSSKDGHAIWMNSFAMREMGIDGSITDPSGGKYLRRSDGSLTGVALEYAVEFVRHRIPAIPDAEKRHRLADAIQFLHSAGVTAVHSFEGLSELELLLSLAESGDLPMKVFAFVNLEDFDSLLSCGYKPGERFSKVQIGGLKLFADGALGTRTAAVSFPYTGEPENTGIDVLDVHQLEKESLYAGKHGFPTAIHAIGDRAVSQALTSLIKVRKAYPKLKGLRIEHAQLIAEQDLGKFAGFDIAVSVQPSHMISDIEMVERYWTHQKGCLYPYQSLCKSGAKMVFGSDAPIDDEIPLHYIDAAVHRQKFVGQRFMESWIPSECMAPVDAYRASTNSPALIELNPENRGLLLPGYAADFIVLNKNPFTSRIKSENLKIEAVYMDGKPVFQASNR